MAKTKAKTQLELVQPENELPREAKDISRQIAERLQEKEEIRKRRDFLSEQPMQLRLEIKELQDEWKKRVALSSKRRLGLGEKEHLIEVTKSPDKPERLKYVEGELDSVIKEINALVDEMNKIDKKIKQLDLDRERVLMRHDCQQIPLCREDLFQGVVNGQECLDRLMKHIHNVQQKYRKLGYQNWTHAMTDHGISDFHVGFIGDYIGGATKMDIWDYVYKLFFHNRPENPIYKHRSKKLGISGFKESGSR